MENTRRINEEIGKRITGNDETIEHLLISLYAGGHILLESLPGLGKTELAKALAQTLDLEYRRIQCTPDLTPADILGTPDEPGPIRTNILLMDEINRAQPKTQSALLEAMAEAKVTQAGRTTPLPQPFLVIATQNPVDYESTFPLPQAQQDRFLIKTRMTYLKDADEIRLITNHHKQTQVRKILQREEILAAREKAAAIKAAPEHIQQIHAIVKATRQRKEALNGASTRATIQYHNAVKARAHLHGRDYTTEADITALAHPVLRHRITMNPDSANYGYTSDKLIDDILRKMRPT